MSKSITSTWLRGLGKLARIQMRMLQHATTRGERAAADLAKSASKSAAAKVAKAGKKSLATASKTSVSKPSTSRRTDPLGMKPTIDEMRKTVKSSATGSTGSTRTQSASTPSVRGTTQRAGASPKKSAKSLAPSKGLKPLEAAKPHKPTKPVDSRDSRVRPSRHAWLKGDWSRSFHSAPPAPGDLVNHLAYGIYVPPPKSNARRTLVVMLHGCKQTSEEFAQGTRMNALADEYGFIVLYPEQSRHAQAHRCWHWYDASERAGGHEARSIVSLVDSVLARYDVDPSRVYVAGMSAGAGMAALLAIRFPQVFAAVALHSGPVIGDAHSAMSALATMRRGTRDDPLGLVGGLSEFATHPGMPAIIVHGDRDDVVSPLNAEQLAMQFVRLNRLVDSSGRRLHGSARESAPGGVVRHDWILDDVPIVRDCRIAGLRHAWSGGDGSVPFHVSDGPDSSRLIYDFFRLHRRSADVDHAPAQPVLIA